MIKARASILVIVAAAILAIPSIPARAEGPPSQAVLTLDMPASAGTFERAATTLEGGGARLRMAAANAASPRTVRVWIGLRYVVPEGTIALDEIVHRIVFSTLDESGAPFATAAIDPNDINLNPNGPRLGYRATLYRPEGPYRVRVEVFGNYE